MKNLKFFAGLTALLCCFQSGVCLTSFADGAYNPGLPTEEPTEEATVIPWELSEEFKTGINAVRDEVQKFIEEKGLSLVYSEVTFGRTEELSYISVRADNTSGAGAGELNLVKTYCEEQGFTEQYTFKFENLVAVPEAENPTEEMQTEFQAGDVTMDDSVDILDVITVNKAVLGKETLTALQNKAADINRDGKVDSSDALEILKQVVGLTE